jgi:hypothetical protein
MPGQQPVKPDDLTQLPVNLNTAQRRMLFGPLKPLFNATRDGADGLHQCAEVFSFKFTFNNQFILVWCRLQNSGRRA